ncbi:RagB/SusD family nutrient uptake outer membrane protein [Sphingobacterium sp. DR205]|uniref:RagB/SusD family nutrient uptake outer membrane protein n=1 Tax=Sphingobacterium sp. DR205 TaxID=2713573 RepID=UPI0013E44888|nr:RagB/SusD family nutrient uptake outer membrane protein [Sphingobacterium sp. DR205]QIH36365.1 RagB/SusD family nutrient uptake outer membrane protein [Sphingobacterium sp. DR205]
MKKLTIFLLLLGLFGSCKMDLDQQPISDATSETFFQTTNDFVQGVNALYNGLQKYPDRLMNLSETRSDNLYAISDGGVRDWEGINSFHKTIASNPYVQEAWYTNYNVIFRINNFLEQLQSKGGTVITDEGLRNRMEGEAKFLRAFLYFDLLRYFGKVPLIDHVVSAQEAKTIPRSNVEDIYTLILSDLNRAVETLPLPGGYAAADRGHANKYAAKMLLGLVYMTRSGPTLSVEGAGLNSNEWGKAIEQFNDIIASNEFLLLDKYADIFDYNKEHNKEVIFNIEYASGANPIVGSTFPWVLVPDNWFNSLGLGTQGGLTIRPVSNDFMSTYLADDMRRSFCIQEGFVYNKVAENRPFVKKFVDVTKVPASRTDWPINYIVFRYTDLLLLKAECVLNGAAGSTTTDVDAVVNQIRKRAGLTAALTNVTKSQLMDERRREFIGEGTRWFDLIRSGTVESVMKAWITKDDAAKQMSAFQVNYVLYPVPQSELDNSPGLYTQNPGY